jgi:hypothetical protein
VVGVVGVVGVAHDGLWNPASVTRLTASLIFR